MAYTTRSDAVEVVCSNCGAQPGDKCVGARGKKRESVHRERLNAAAAALKHEPLGDFHISGDRLLDGDGNAVGKVHGIDLLIQSEALVGNLRRGEGDGVVDVDVPLKAVEGSSRSEETLSQGGGAGGAQTALLEDPVVETWRLYTELLERPKATLTPKVRRWINDAHQAVGVERTNDAIRGLAASEYHRQNGYIGIEYAITPKARETVEGRIEMMAAKADARPNGRTTVDGLIGRLPSEAQPMVRQWISDVEAMLRNPDHPGLRQTGQSRLNDLRDKAHIEPIIEDGCIITDWKDVRR